MIEELILVGGGGHCKACIEVIETTGLAIKGILDKDNNQQFLLNYPVIGNDDEIQKQIKNDTIFLITIGQIKNAKPRINVYEKILALKGRLAIVISPAAIVSKHSDIGEGTIIMHHALVNAGVSIGNNCIINTKALIEHDCKIHDHTHISTSAVINGACTIGQRVFIGSNSVLLEGTSIADDVVIGAGSIVIHDISQPGIYAGNPLKRISSLKKTGGLS